jgi:hypothetical protein
MSGGKDRGSANFIFGMGFGKSTDENTSPSNVGENWKSGNTMQALPPASVWSNFQAYVVGTRYQYGFEGPGVRHEVGEWHSLDTGNQAIPTFLNVMAPFYDSSGNSLWTRDDTLHKMGIGSYNVPQWLHEDVMDDRGLHAPSASVRYPLKGWSPYGQWDMDGGPVS